jgi:hypothetical protein
MKLFHSLYDIYLHLGNGGGYCMDIEVRYGIVI